MQLDDILRALSHPTRREILWLVWDRALLAGDLADRFDVAGPTVSAHLKVVRETGLVDVTRMAPAACTAPDPRSCSC